MTMSVSAELLQKTTINHRHGERRRTFALVEIKCRQGKCPGLMYNISRDGMYVLSKNVPKLHKRVDICISLFNRKGSPVVIPGMVVHRSNHGFGVLFRELDDTTRGVVNKLLGRYRDFNVF